MPKLSHLKFFNPALIYSFEPESSPKALLYGEDMNEALYKLGQSKDMLIAYRYAEEVILPWVQENGQDALTPEIFENWILNLHERIGKTLLSISDEGKSGEYSRSLVIRWHYGSSMMNQLGLYIEELLDPQPTQSEFLNILITEHEGLDANDAKQFLRILQRLAVDDTAPIHSSLKERMTLQKPSIRFTLALNRLATAWHENLLPNDEREVVEKIALFVDYPERLPVLMRDFVETMVPRWKNLSRNDLNAVSEFCSDLFYQFTHIHPFPNANGRTATALNNIVLQSIGLPDILMRKPGDRQANTGSYATAIAVIEKDRRPLAAHMRQCIIEAQTNPFSNPTLAKIFEVRMALNTISKQIKTIKPNYDLDQITQSLIAKNHFLLRYIDPANNEHSLITCQLMLPIAQETLTALMKEAECAKSATPSVTSVSLLKSPYDRKALHKKMEELTGVMDWKITNKGSLNIWRYCASEADANEIVNRLRRLDFCETKVRTTEAKGEKIVLCSSINIEKMLKSIPLDTVCCDSITSKK